jgi:hypothetical protein
LRLPPRHQGARRPALTRAHPLSARVVGAGRIVCSASLSNVGYRREWPGAIADRPVLEGAFVGPRTGHPPGTRADQHQPRPRCLLFR